MSGNDSTDNDADQSVWDEIEKTSVETHSGESTGTANDETTAPKRDDTNRSKPDSDELFAQLDDDRSTDGTESLGADEIVEQMDVSQVDGEALWDELAGFDTDVDEPLDAATDTTVDTEQASETIAVGGSSAQADREDHTDSDGTEAVVDKRKYCQQCPYFSKPPEVSCSHDGTSIVEVLIDGQFRLRGCPVVTDEGPDRTILNDGS